MLQRVVALQLRSLSQNKAVCTRLLSNVVDDKDQSSEETHFGFSNVRTSEKQSKVNEVFSNVATRYDLMNDAMSGGIHRIWKDIFVQRIAPDHSLNCLDVAGGTGDIAFRLIDFARHEFDQSLEEEVKNFSDPLGGSEDLSDFENVVSMKRTKDLTMTVCDINKEMVEVGEDRARQRKPKADIKWVVGNAENLPFDDNIFDLYTIAFGIRNCTDVSKVLREAYRVLRPYGRFACLEFSEVNPAILRRLYDEYSFQVIPVMGQVLAGDWDSYQYLVESIRRFPNQETFRQMIVDAGFSEVTVENLTFGVSAIHSGFKLR